MKRKAKTIDEYLSHVPKHQRVVLEALRKTIKKIAPRAEECISYSLPAFRLDGRVIAGFAAGAKLCSYYPFSGRTLATVGDAVARYPRSRGALRFEVEHPLPATLVRKLVKARIAEDR